MRIALFSDIHALADTYAAAIDAAVAEGFDQAIVMGDLLSYGTQVEETLELTDRLVADHSAMLLRGNHDQMYFDLAEGNASYLDGRPGWIVETALWTSQRVGGLRTRYEWLDEWSGGGVFASHANPFGPGNWAYIRSDEDARRAAEVLDEQGFRLGVFGHVHRPRSYEFPSLPTVATVASVGQPREAGGTPGWTMLVIEEAEAKVESRPLAIDVRAHVARLESSGMSAETVAKLAGFFR